MRRIDPRAVFKMLLALMDVAIVAGGFIGAYWLRFHLPFFPPPPEADFGTYVRFAFLIGFVCFFALYASGMYRLQQPFFGIDDFFAVLKSVTLAHITAAALGFAVRGRIPGEAMETYSRIVIAISWLGACVLLTCWRLCFDLILAWFRRRGVALTRVVVLGDDDFGRSFFALLRDHPELGYAPAGELVGCEVESLRAHLKRHPVDEVMLATQQATSDHILSLMSACQESRVRFSMVPTLFHVLTSRIQVREIAGVPIFVLEERIFLRSSRVLKRTIDLLLGGAMLLLSAPVFAVVAVLIKLESKGPVFYAQTRIGKGARPFRCFKFRSMYQDADARKRELAAQNEAQGPLFKMRNDPRRTLVGRVIRKLSIDELPQLINVFKGDMSFVGPRPDVPGYADALAGEDRLVLAVRPGITGPATLKYRNEEELLAGAEDPERYNDEVIYPDKVRLNREYVQNWSFWGDLRYIWQTIFE